MSFVLGTTRYCKSYPNVQHFTELWLFWVVPCAGVGSTVGSFSFLHSSRCFFRRRLSFCLFTTCMVSNVSSCCTSAPRSFSWNWAKKVSNRGPVQQVTTCLNCVGRQKVLVGAALYLFCGNITETLLSQSGAVEPVQELLDLQQFVLQQLQADDTIQISVILLLKQRHVFVQLGQTSLQTQQQSLEIKSLHVWRTMDEYASHIHS